MGWYGLRGNPILTEVNITVECPENPSEVRIARAVCPTSSESRLGCGAVSVHQASTKLGFIISASKKREKNITTGNGRHSMFVTASTNGWEASLTLLYWVAICKGPQPMWAPSDMHNNETGYPRCESSHTCFLSLSQNTRGWTLLIYITV